LILEKGVCHAIQDGMQIGLTVVSRAIDFRKGCPYYTRWDANQIDGGVVAVRSRAIGFRKGRPYYTRWDANWMDGGVVAARSRAIHSGR